MNPGDIPNLLLKMEREVFITEWLDYFRTGKGQC